MNHKKWIAGVSLVLAALMLCACAKVPQQETSAPTTQPMAPTEPPTIPIYEEVENPITYFSLSMGENYRDVLQMNVFCNDSGTVHVEYVGAVKKVGDFDANILHGITAAFRESGLEALVGQDIYDEGEANGSMYIEFTDGSVAAVGFSGNVPEAFKAGYEAMDALFQQLTAPLPVYVPRPVVLGEVEATLLEETMAILEGSGNQALDMFTVSQVGMFEAGLSSTDGIRSVVSVGPMMMTTAYSLVIVRLEDTSLAEAVCDDFEKNLDWFKWVCVAPSSAVIAQKGDMVLCLMTYEDLESGTPYGIRQAGWEEVKTFTHPNMQG